MTQQGLSAYVFVSLFVILFSLHNLCAIASHDGRVVAVATVYIFVPQPHEPIAQQTSPDEHVITINNLRHFTDERRYPSRIELIHAYIDSFKNGCLSWWYKEKMD
jgi:hypothetical protein